MIVVTTTTTSGRLQRDMATLQPRMVAAVSRGMQHIRRHALERQTENLSTATGNLRRSNIAGAEVDGGAVVGFLNLAEYWKWVEHGSDPHMPPVEPLLRYVRAKGLVAKASGFVQMAESGVGPNGKALSPRAHARAQEIAAQVGGYAKQFPAGKRLPGRRAVAVLMMTETQAHAVLASPDLPETMHKLAKQRLSRKLNPLEKAEMSMAWRIAMAIKKHGTRPHPFVGPGVRAGMPAMIREIAGVFGSVQ